MLSSKLVFKYPSFFTSSPVISSHLSPSLFSLHQLNLLSYIISLYQFSHFSHLFHFFNSLLSKKPFSLLPSPILISLFYVSPSFLLSTSSLIHFPFSLNNPAFFRLLTYLKYLSSTIFNLSFSSQHHIFAPYPITVHRLSRNHNLFFSFIPSQPFFPYSSHMSHYRRLSYSFPHMYISWRPCLYSLYRRYQNSFTSSII